MILGIDTAGTALSVAVANADGACGSLVLQRPNAHDALLAPAIRDLLTHCGISPADLTGLAVTAGPGSFTGLRIGMALAKGMAATLGIPLAAVPTLDALAFATRRFIDAAEGSTLFTVLDARREQLYHASYVLEKDGWKRRGEAVLAAADEIAASLPQDVLLAGDGIPMLLARSTVRVHPLRHAVADASDVALLGMRQIEAGETADPASCEPLYMQEFIVKQAKNALFPSSD